MHPVMTRGDRKPALTITLSDARSNANFAAITAADVTVIGEMDGAVVFSGTPDLFTPAADGKSATIRREWAIGDTAVAGRLWVTVVVEWPTDVPQSFPDDGPLRIDIIRAPGDS